MLTRSIVRVVGFCTRHAWAVIVLAVVLAIGSCVHTARHFAINANIDDLMSPRLDWRQREIAYHTEYPQSMQLVLVVVDGPTPEAASAASGALVESLAKRKDLFRSVIDQGALIQALTDKVIAGAGLDVYAKEPHAPDALTALPNVVLTPHTGGHTLESHMGMQDCVMANLAAFFAGQPLAYPSTQALQQQRCYRSCIVLP